MKNKDKVVKDLFDFQIYCYTFQYEILYQDVRMTVVLRTEN